jgi:hypothetical protein
MRDIGEKQFSIVASGDTKPNSWTLLDFGDVVVHIFLPQQRAFYNLEEFYGNATSIELPFEKQLQWLLFSSSPGEIAGFHKNRAALRHGFSTSSCSYVTNCSEL